jgi:hypothetical protein
MPCSSGYLDPTNTQRELQRAAKLLLYVYDAFGATAPQWIVAASVDLYCDDDRVVPALCDQLKRMTSADMDRIVYNARDRQARDLADWWEEHQAADLEREAIEKAAAQEKATIIDALAKLEPNERYLIISKLGDALD